MLDTLNGPWFLCAALALLIVAIWRGALPERREVWLAVGIAVVAAIARILWGVWGPLHVNGQGSLWIRGALDPNVLAAYGPGYYELFGWLARRAGAPDQAIFAANAFLSAISPALLYVVARLVGVARGGALAAAVALALDAVTIDTAASELYIWPAITLVLAVQVALGVFIHARIRGDVVAAAGALAAACCFGAAAARIQPIAYLPLALAPLIVLCAGRPEQWFLRIRMTVEAAVAIGVTVLLTSGAAIATALGEAPVTGHGIVGMLFAQGAHVWLVALLVGVAIAQLWARPPWLPLVAVAALVAMLMIEAAFQRHPYQALFYARVCWPGLLLGASALLPQRLQRTSWGFAAGAIAAILLQIPAWSYLGTRTTEQREYAFLQEVLPGLPANCTLAAVGRAGKRVWDIPAYLMASGQAREVASENDARALLDSAPCVVYVRSSLCTSVEGRPLCDAVQHALPLERVGSRMLVAAPSDVDLPYDQPQVEVTVYRGEGRGTAVERESTVPEGVAITPDFAKSLFERWSVLQESDGCRLVRFDTSRFRITVGLQAPSGTAHMFDLAATRDAAAGGRRIGDWVVAVPPALERECGVTFAAIERALQPVSAPPPPRRGNAAAAGFITPALIVGSLLLLMLGTAGILYREMAAHRPPASAVIALVCVSAAGLALRLFVSPRTFLHEYYHIAETLSAYLRGTTMPAYGQVGPTLYHTVALLVGRPDDEQVIFLTNAVFAAAAIPAVALLDLALRRSWPRALCAAGLLCVMPLHLRFSAAEDLFVLAVTFAIWALALFALYLRTQRLADACCAALALALAMQTRPEMLFLPGILAALVLCVEPRSWRVLFDRRTWMALAIAGALLIPRLYELHGVLSDSPSPRAALPELTRYLANLVLFHAAVTPPVYWILLAMGAVWSARRAPGLLVWVGVVYIGCTLFSVSMFDGPPPYRLRSQLLPTSLTVLIAAGTASWWMERWGARRRVALGAGAAALAGVATVILTSAHGFITELRDQQLEWAFIERTVPQLPPKATLVTAVQVGGRNLNAFPDLVLSRAGKHYELVDVQDAVDPAVAVPNASGELLYYQGMFCYFAFFDEPPPDPMTAACRAVHDRYVVEPLFVEDLHTPGYSLLRYAGDGEGPFKIGFFRLTPRTD